MAEVTPQSLVPWYQNASYQRPAAMTATAVPADGLPLGAFLDARQPFAVGQLGHNHLHQWMYHGGTLYTRVVTAATHEALRRAPTPEAKPDATVGADARVSWVFSLSDHHVDYVPAGGAARVLLVRVDTVRPMPTTQLTQPPGPGFTPVPVPAAAAASHEYRRCWFGPRSPQQPAGPSDPPPMYLAVVTEFPAKARCDTDLKSVAGLEVSVPPIDPAVFHGDAAPCGTPYHNMGAQYVQEHLAHVALGGIGLRGRW